jgi:hypothetical protein
MSESQSRSILEAVAAGDISPSEASVLLDAVAPRDDEPEETQVIGSTGQAPADPPSEEPEPTVAFAEHPTPADVAPIRVQVSAALHGGPIAIDCRPDADHPYADGPANVRVDGDATNGYTIEGNLGDDSVIVLPTDIDLRLEANGNNFTLTGIHGTVTAALNVGDVAIEGRLADGESRIEANAGAVELRLLPGSDVEIVNRAPAEMRADGLEHTGRGRWTMGAGAATCEITGNLGMITITPL